MKSTLCFGVSILVGIMMIFTTTVFAQSDTPDKQSAVQVTFVPALSTNGLHSIHYSNNFSFNILLGISKNENAFAFGGLANIITNSSKGFQFAGLLNSVKNESCGMLFAGLFNKAKDMNGIQFAGLCNVAQHVNGAQIAGLVNRAKNVSGVQIAGLINMAENSDYPIGLINLIKNGERGIAVSYNEIGSTSVTFRSGGDVTYGIFGFGYNHKVGDNSFSGKDLLKLINLSSFVTTAGIGAHMNISSWFRINNELCSDFITDDFSSDATFTFKTGYALMPAFRIGHMEVFGGPSINYLQTNNLNNDGLFPANSIWKNYTFSKMQQVYVGYQVGAQYIF